MKANLKFIIGITVLLGILVYLKTLAPQNTNWTPTYSDNNKIPFGTWILRNSLEDLFPESTIIDNSQSFYEGQNNNGTNTNLLIITSDFNPDSLDLMVLFHRAEQGAEILIASKYWPRDLIDPLHLEIERLQINVRDSATNLQSRVGKKWGPEYHFTKLIQIGYFELPDSTDAIPLGKGNNHINFVKVPYGKGHFLLHIQPQVFTNYHLLYNDHHYLEEVLAWLPQNGEPLEWDEYYKPFRRESSSPLKIILSIEALRTAYWTLLIGLLLYILSNIQRRQRPIPVVRPKANLSLDFVQTIGLLYFNQRNHKDLVKKIFVVFSEHISSKYFIRIEFTPEFYRKLALKSNVSEKVINRIFTRYETLVNKDRVYEDELIQFNALIEIFHHKSNKPVETHALKNNKTL
ncbi:MAG TPA: DUF4350 domain-containing protein [Sunxiuqinia sp.]|nr:DUF4350 domain-containing protein [Sunxiuqinia sp.]